MHGLLLGDGRGKGKILADPEREKLTLYERAIYCTGTGTPSRQSRRKFPDATVASQKIWASPGLGQQNGPTAAKWRTQQR